MGVLPQGESGIQRGQGSQFTCSELGSGIPAIHMQERLLMSTPMSRLVRHWPHFIPSLSVRHQRVSGKGVGS